VKKISAAGGLGHDAELYEGGPEPGALGHMDDVAVQQEGEPEAHAHPIHGGQQWLVEGTDLVHAVCEAVSAIRVVVPAGHLAEVLTCRKGPLGAGHYHDAYSVAGPGVGEGAGQLAPHLVVEGVALLRTIQREQIPPHARYSPLNSGLRFSRNEAMPSRKSLDRNNGRSWR
jgi:hypothetical protein